MTKQILKSLDARQKLMQGIEKVADAAYAHIKGMYALFHSGGGVAGQAGLGGQDQPVREHGLGEQLDGIYISSDYRCRKPDVRFFNALIEEQKLDISRCLMIGNDLHTDIGGAKNADLDTLYMHTNLTPAHQPAANPRKRAPHREFEGFDWKKLMKKL